jgi:hypothetical protein
MTEEKDKTPNPSRRQFIKSSAIAAAGFMIVPRHVLGGKGFIAPSDKLLIAGVGAGGKGQSDIANFYKSGKAEIAFLCDVDDRRSAKSRAISLKQSIIKTGAKCTTKSTKTLMPYRFQPPIITTLSSLTMLCS